MALRPWVAAAGLAALATLGALGFALADHQEARGRWARARQALGTEAYDPRASDEAYAQSRAAWALAEHSARALALSLTLLGIAWGPRPSRASGAEAGAAALALATLLDGLLAAGLLALMAVDDGESAAAHALRAAAPILSFAATAVPLATAGRSLGLACVGGGCAPSRRGALAAALLLPIALLCLPAALRRPRWAGLHWRLAGLRVRRTREA